MTYHSTVDHIFTFSIIAKELCNTKTNLFCCFVGFRKSFDMVPRKNLRNRLEEIKVPLELRVATIRMYENVIAKFKNTRAGQKRLTTISESNKVVPCPLSFLAYTLTSKRLLGKSRLCRPYSYWYSHQYSSICR